MDNHYIQGLKINWERLGERSYITEIQTLKNLSELIIHSNITFLKYEKDIYKFSVEHGMCYFPPYLCD